MSEPIFNPERALGWRGGNPLDGLNCYLRCIEAVLLAKGYSPELVARGLVTPIDLTGSSRDKSNIYPACRIHWYGAEDRKKNWGEIKSILEQGEYVILRPDRYYWPGTPHYQSRHWADHMMLLVCLEDNVVTLLNTEGLPNRGYREDVPVTDEFIKACVSYGTIEYAPADWLQKWHAYQSWLLDQSRKNLARDMPSLQRFLSEWKNLGLSGDLAKALHTMLLGDFQPPLFLLYYLSPALDPRPSAVVVELLRSLASRSMLTAFCLLGEDAQLEAGFYPISLYAFSKLIDQLLQLQREFEILKEPIIEPDGNSESLDADFHHRLQKIAQSFACEVESSTATEQLLNK